jgi:hypothetical protein
LKQITDINKDNYSKLVQGKSELKMVKTTDGKEMGVWFHYPPNFDRIKNIQRWFIVKVDHNLH